MTRDADGFVDSPGRAARALGAVMSIACAAGAFAQQSVVDSLHNLSASGPGRIRAASEPQVCIFCHTPHGSSPVEPLWNRAAPVVPYTVYSSSALDARPGQPTGASKMCLSCHDGSIALGSVLSRDQEIRMAGVITTLPPGGANLGTDLSDDHPISFVYDSALATRDGRLADPHALRPGLHLDRDGEMQCTTCHDPHDDSFDHFLVMDNTDSALCIACHQIADTTVTAHEDCRACHRPHSAPSGPFLLTAEAVTETCTACHDGSVTGAADIAADLMKVSVHDTDRPVDPADRAAHATCIDCHDAHTMMVGAPARAPVAAANFGQPVVDEAGGHGGTVATYEYEVCFRCHDDDDPILGFSLAPTASRAIVQPSVKREFDPTGPSYHPVVAAGRNSDVPSLRAGMTESSLVLCSDCHGSDTSRKAGGSGPNGVHGSNSPPLLLARYETLDFTPESSAAYALCYRCHERDGAGGILSDASFPHRLHVVDARTPCSACHDAHGIDPTQGTLRNNSHLINFDTSIVFPDPVTGRREFVDMGTFSGSCTLSCHGVPHSPLEY